jgi:parallel beta-helix repeat protein
MDNDHYGRYFDTQTNILSDTVSGEKTILLRSYTENGRKLNNYNNPMIINKPVNITSFDNAKYNGDISFVAGSEGSNITGLTLNGNLYINAGNINVKNNTVNNAVYIHDASNVVVEENVFNTDTIPIELTSSIASTIRNNNITTGSDYTITLDSECAENTITGNDLIAGTLQGDNSVLDNGQDNSISLNTPIVYTPELVVDTTEFSVGSPATITASIYLGEEVDTNVNKGKVVFKVNGKTLKDVSTGKVIYAKMNGGVATITDYEIPSSWAKDNITIQAVYSGSSQCDALRAEANLTVTKDSPAITTSDVTASKGETVTLTATVAAGDTPVNVGKVIFKVNGKTVKDSNGKVIYASVVNGQVSVNYTVPENMKAGSYNITVTFTAPGYEKLTDTKTLTVSA